MWCSDQNFHEITPKNVVSSHPIQQNLPRLIPPNIRPTPIQRSIPLPTPNLLPHANLFLFSLPFPPSSFSPAAKEQAENPGNMRICGALRCFKIFSGFCSVLSSRPLCRYKKERRVFHSTLFAVLFFLAVSFL